MRGMCIQYMYYYTDVTYQKSTHIMPLILTCELAIGQSDEQPLRVRLCLERRQAH